MNNLTMRDEYNNADIIGVDSEKLQDGLTFKEFNYMTKALNKLADYEDLGVEPERLKEFMGNFGISVVMKNTKL
ncbi:MAG TPA: hypothetical protein VFC79_02205 [Tissierellaceae bacterium]|nr:hypothetical protein [Tissierellaceae bacterium]